ncbi:hypothetical protein P4H70_28085 [Paenibacillus ehimensis]|uniref:hypothetical protein n=1 Tax=Paenibacillus ehimensis TaxID=79264 RepID=UPI002DBE1B8B|nr:hypothetical protein [Paenibacillus ehimensis]MEC0212794.1 hypothetical protein [Paenibacillus ehimensis]
MHRPETARSLLFFMLVLIFLLFSVGCKNENGLTKNDKQNSTTVNSKMQQVNSPTNTSPAFDPRKIKVGDKIGSMAVASYERIRTELSNEGEYVAQAFIQFTGEAEVTGTFKRYPLEREYLDGEVVFQVDENQNFPQMKIRDTPEEYRPDEWIVLSLDDETKRKFGPPDSEGRATLVLTDYKIEYGPTEISDHAQLKKIVNIKRNNEAATKESSQGSKPIEIIGTPIKEQSFASIPFEKFGSSQFISTMEQKNNKKVLHFYVQGPEQTVELNYEPASPDSIHEVKAVSFKDVNGDGLKDIIIVVDYTTGFGYMGAIPISEILIFLQTDEGFVESKALEDQVSSASPYRMLDIPAALELLKSGSKSGASQFWARLASRDYILEGSDEYGGSTLTIEKVSGNSIIFSLSAFHVTGGDEGIKNGSVNIGELSSVTAYLSGTEMIYRDGDYELSISLNSPDTIYVRDNGVSRYGAGVQVNGEYGRERTPDSTKNGMR